MALGRGLGQILFEVEEAYEKDLSDIGSFELEAQGARVAEIDVEMISPNPFQPRKNFDENSIIELSHSIVEYGLLQPIVVIAKEEGYLLIAGERRLRAHKLAKLTHIKAIVAEVEIDEIRLRELALIENIQRENLNAIELAHSYSELIEVHNITHDELSHIVYKSRSQITNTIRLLTLSSYTQEQLTNNKISQGHAKVLVGIDEKEQKIIVDSIIGQKLSVREIENMVKKYKNKVTQVEKKIVIENLLDNYKEKLKSLLPFNHILKGKKLVITLDNEKDIQNFLRFLKKP